MSEVPSWLPGDITPDHYPYMFALGVLSKKWADCERAIEFLIWDYLTDGNRSDGELITTHLPNKTRIDMLNSLADAKGDPVIAECIANAGKVFDAVRVNRNLLAHTQVGGVINGVLYAFRTTSNGKLKQDALSIKVGRIQETVMQTHDLHRHLIEIHVHFRGLGPLPHKLQIPPRLLNTLLEDHNLHMQQHPLPA